MKTLVILNPASGKGRGGKLLKTIRNYLSEHLIECTLIITESIGHATEIARIESKNFQKIIVGGGDGTLNEVLNGLDLTVGNLLGLLPVGSGNDFAKALKLPKPFLNNLNLVFSDKPKSFSSDIGHVDIYTENNELIRSNHFANSCGIGFDAYVAHLNQSNKVFTGLPSYIIAIIKALWEHNSVEISATFDEREYNGEKLFICIGNGETAGGGLYLTPGAVINDGYLNFTVVEKISRLKLLGYLPLAVVNRLSGTKYVKMDKFKSASIRLKKPFYVHNDGEIVAESASIINIESLNSELKFIVP
jgi:YegS/Rv2252/BmrU family lipid kinase